ncbi:Putative beta-1,3-glucanase, Osmotin/thaumatin-like superfamily [Septoria linicola]|uniref:Beta-1,3-glucanase, Osmotin/thaumatin-like superfamily n=1 Tax=Septoria linicola TaxID=215465 RepID=A0A9Q9AXW9_9PEZI|nr:putative beta-1,3-glucanase, Osmotin/thaumatin-like superfamily [Septoria linicola]USW53937.1 Putative beta-1,3-glucanase, Osmotin/thaumatin-like superfamily [Septoria linicola]
MLVLFFEEAQPPGFGTSVYSNETPIESRPEDPNVGSKPRADSQPRITLVNNLVENAKTYITCKNAAGNWAYIGRDMQLHELVTGGVISQEDVGLNLGAMGSEQSFWLAEYVSECRIYGSQDDMQLEAVWSADGRYSFVQPAIANPGDPNYAVNFGILEFSYRPSPGKTCANPSQVDFIDVSMGFEMRTNGGE